MATERELRELAREHTEEAIETLIGLMRTGNNRSKLAAAREMLDRGWGKPQASANVTHDASAGFLEKFGAIFTDARGFGAVEKDAG